MDTKTEVKCPACNGDGHLGKDECLVCYGRKTIPAEMATYEAQTKGY